MTAAVVTPRREVIHAEALAWLDAHPAEARTSVVTSLPDTSELPELTFDAWRTWFVEAARRVIRWVPDDGVAIFFQSDVLHHGVWIDKAYLVMRAAEDEGAALVFHRIVCREPPGTPTQGRASYSHLVCVARTARPVRRPRADVLPTTGHMTWTKATSVEACRAACAYLLDETDTRLVVDPFCGRGSVLAVANAHGLDALGIELNLRRCRAARTLTVPLAEGDEVDAHACP